MNTIVLIITICHLVLFKAKETFQDSLTSMQVYALQGGWSTPLSDEEILRLTD